jgi:predicted transcriptional regulator
MKTAISIDNETFVKADTLARKMGLSRSSFFTKAAEEFIEEHQEEEITRELDDYYASHDSRLDPEMKRAAFSMLQKAEWDD